MLMNKLNSKGGFCIFNKPQLERQSNLRQNSDENVSRWCWQVTHGECFPSKDQTKFELWGDFKEWTKVRTLKWFQRNSHQSDRFHFCRQSKFQNQIFRGQSRKSRKFSPKNTENVKNATSHAKSLTLRDLKGSIAVAEWSRLLLLREKINEKPTGSVSSSRRPAILKKHFDSYAAAMDIVDHNLGRIRYCTLPCCGDWINSFLKPVQGS